MAAAWAVHCDLQRFAPPGSSQCVYFFHRNGCQLLRIFQVDCRLLPAELRTDLGKIAVGISALIIAFLFNESFIYGWLCFDLISILELITFLCGLFVLRRSSVKETILMLAIGIVAALLLHQIVPYGF